MQSYDPPDWYALKEMIIEQQNKVDGLSDPAWNAYDDVLEMMADLEKYGSIG